nr:hypothetical protein [Tanacetum cinerariifolium]
CLSCGALYTGDFCCSKGNVEDKILIPKLPKNYARCAKCRHPVNGPYCQGCTLLREKLEEDLVTYFQDFQNTSESSDDSTNVVNAPQEPFVVKKGHGVNPPHIDECCCECVPCVSKPNFVDESSNVFNPPPEPPIYYCEFCGSNAQYSRYCTPQAPFINPEPGYDDDDDDDVDYTIAITPVLSTEEPVDSLSMGDEHLDTILATESDEVIKSSVEDLVLMPSESEEFKNFYFDLGEISSGSTTTHSDISLLDYKAFSFNNDHIEEISSGSTTTHSDISLSDYDSFVFDPSNDQFPPTDMSDFTDEEFADELAHIISPPEYDCFCFRNLSDPGELISILNSEIYENLSTTSVNLPVEDDHSHLLAYVVWIFLAYLTYPVITLYLHSFGNEDTIFDPGITINRVYSFKPGLSHRCGAFKKFNTYRSHLNEWPMIINGKNTPILDVFLFHFYPP